MTVACCCISRRPCCSERALRGPEALSVLFWCQPRRHPPYHSEGPPPRLMWAVEHTVGAREAPVPSVREGGGGHGHVRWGRGRGRATTWGRHPRWPWGAFLGPAQRTVHRAGEHLTWGRAGSLEPPPNAAGGRKGAPRAAGLISSTQMSEILAPTCFWGGGGGQGGMRAADNCRRSPPPPPIWTPPLWSEPNTEALCQSPPLE